MKRLILVVAVLLPLIGVFLLADSGPDEEQPVAPRQPLAADIDEAAGDGTAAPAASPPLIRVSHEPELPQTLLADEAIDVTGDGAPERVQLYVDAERGEDGRIRWDDGQRWLLLVRAGGGYFTLFDEYVQIGDLRFWVATEEDEVQPRILLMRDTGAGMQLRSYRFEAPDGFSSEIEFAFTGNVIYSSPQAR